LISVSKGGGLHPRGLEVDMVAGLWVHFKQALLVVIKYQPVCSGTGQAHQRLGEGTTKPRVIASVSATELKEERSQQRRKLG
jgi:hypothetical protein